MDTVKKLIRSDLSTGILLILATILALIIANSPLEHMYHKVFHEMNIVGNFNLHMIVNDFFMAIFFLVVGIEIRKEILYGNLSSIKKASFPIIAALGGVIAPAIIFLLINMYTPYKMGVGIPISTDIVFAIAIFMLMKNKLNPVLKVFLLSLAVVDDLISIFAIGVLYSSEIDYSFLIIAAMILLFIIMLNKKFKINKILPYIILGLALWIIIHKSGIDATISGVLLAFVVPINDSLKHDSIADKIEHLLSPICNLMILPLFAFANTAINLNVKVSILLASIVTIFSSYMMIVVIPKLSDKLEVFGKARKTAYHK